MSIFWDRKTYTAFKYTVFSKWSPREKLTWKYWPVPGCRGHRDIVGERRGDILFEHFQKRPQKSHGLYWRTHPEEYKAFIKHIKS
jgi:hypothetical protein